MYIRFLVAVSLASSLALCKPAEAGEENIAASGRSISPAGGWHVGGYFSTNFNLHPGGTKETSLSDASLFLSWEGDARWQVFSELELEDVLHWKQPGSPSTRQAAFDIERLYADYIFSEQATLRMGRFLNPVGSWNLIHADPLVWTTQRPLSTEHLFPLNTNGVQLKGELPIGDGAVEYAAFGEVMRDLRINGDEHRFENTKGARIAFSHVINAGVSLLDFNECTPGKPHYRLVGLDMAMMRNGWEFNAEGFQRFKVGGGEAGSGGYFQGVMPIAGGWFAVGRVETLYRPAEQRVNRWLLGATWRMDEKRVLKFNYTGGNDEQRSASKGLFASFAVLF